VCFLEVLALPHLLPRDFVFDPSVYIVALALLSAPDRSTLTQLSFGWISLFFIGVSTYFRAVMMVFVGLPPDMTFLSLYNCMTFSVGIIPAIADSASLDTLLYAFVIKIRYALCICCSLPFAFLILKYTRPLRRR